MELNQELLKRLDVLAEKIGTTGAHLWEVLTRQARVELVSDALFAVLAIAALYGMTRWWKRIITSDFDSDNETLAAAVISIPVVVLTIASTVGLFDVPTLIFNPEYWAFQQIMSALK